MRPGAPRTDVAAAGFDAFISYSQKSDRVLAEALRGGLHRFARPWYRLRAVRVFQDVASLSANPGLWPTIEEALSRSRHLVILASPQAAASKWVRQEIEYWRANKPADALLLAVTDGDYAWDDLAGDFDWSRSDAVPRALAGAFGHEPFVVDLRGLAAPEQRSLRHTGFHTAVARLAAHIRGIPLDALLGEDVVQHRRRRRVIWATVVVLALLAVAASAAAVVATHNANTAEKRLRDVSSRQLAAQALELKSGSMDTALLLAAQAWRTSPTPAARNGLLSVVQEAEQGLEGYLRLPPGVAAPFSLDTVAVSHDGRWAVAGHCPCGSFSAGDAGGPDDGRVFVWRTDRPDRTALVLDPRDRTAGDLAELLPGADGRFVLSLDTQGRVRLWDTRTRTVRAQGPAYEPAWITSTGDGRHFAAVVAAGRVVFFDALTGRRTAEVQGDLLRADGAATRRPVLVGTDAQGRLVLWDVRTGRVLGRGPVLGAAPADIPAPSFSADGRRVAVVVGTDRARAVVLDTADASVVATVRPPGGGSLAQAALRPDGKEIALVDSGGRLATLPVAGGAARLDVRMALATGAEVSRLVYSPSGRLLSVTTADGTSGGTFKYVVTAATGAVRAGLQVWDAQFAAGEKLILGWRDTRVVVGDLTSGLTTRVEPVSVSAAARSADSRYAAIAEGDRVRLWDLTSDDARPVELPGVVGGVQGLAFAGTRLIGVGSTGSAVVWDIGRAVRHHLAATLPFDPNDSRRGVGYAMADDGRGFVTVTRQGRVQVHDLTTGRALRTFDLPLTTTATPIVSLSPDGGHLLVCCTDETRSADGSVSTTTTLVRMSDGRTLHAFRDLASTGLGFSGDGGRLVRVTKDPKDGARAVTVYDTAHADGPPVVSFPLTGFGATDTLTFALDRTGARFAVTDAVGRTAVHDVATGRRLMLCARQMGPSAGGSRGIAFDPRGTTVAVSSQDAATRLLTPGGDGGCRVLATVPGSGHTVAFSPDGTLLFTEGDMRLRDTETLEVVGEPLFDDAGLAAAVFFTTSGRLMQVSYDGTVRALALDPEELTRRACRLAGRELTREEWSRFGVLGDYGPRCSRS
ncbi:toll/interleukin-1 receptor domain-containing protein [Streptomyces sp. NPDC002276]